MRSHNSNPITAIVSLAALAAGVAAGVWIYRNRQHIPEWKKDADKLKRKLEMIQSQMHSEWLKRQSSFEDWAEDWKQDPKKQVSKVIAKARDFAEERVREIGEKTQGANKSAKKAVRVAKANLSNFDLNERQEAIYQIIKKAARANMQEFAAKVEGVTTRTLRRDLTKLEKLGLIEQVGKTKDSFYRVRR